MRTSSVVIGLLLSAIAIGAINETDMDEQAVIDKRYCDNVASGAWPDYEKTFDAYCPKT